MSWWGSAYATSYNVKRWTSTSGPWTTIATGITDLLTYTDNPGAGTWYYVVSGNIPGGTTADSNRATTLVGKSLHTYLPCNEVTGTAVGSGAGRYMFLTPRASSSQVRFAITLDGGGELTVEDSAALPTAQWVHVAVPLAGQTATLYVNGTAVGGNSADFVPPWQPGGTMQNWIGRSQYAGDPYFNGKVDEFRIYRGALSAAEIAALVSST